MNIKSQKGEITTAVLIGVAVVSLFVGFFTPKINPLKGLFGSSTKSAVGEHAEFTTQIEKIRPKIYKVDKEGNVIVVHDVDLTYETGKSQNVPKPTFGQMIGNWFFKATTWTIVFVLISIFAFGGVPLIWLWKRGNAFKETLVKTVKTVKKVKEKDPEAYAVITNELAKEHDQKDKKVVDKIKTELN